MSLQAHLAEFNLSEIIYLLAHFKKTGVITIRAGKNYGEVYFNRGRAVHAVFGDIKGSEAVYNLCLENSGEIRFTAGTRSPEETIKEGADTLLQEGDRRRLEMAEIIKSLPPFNTVLVRTAQAPDETAITIRRSDWTIMALVNGKRDIRSIIEDSKLGVLEVVKTLSWFLSKSLVMDPFEAERILRQRIGLVNLLLEEFGVKGSGVGPWMELAKATLAQADQDRRMSRQVEFTGYAVKLTEGKKLDLGKEEIIAIWDQVIEAIHQKGVKEFGPMLAKHKYQTVLNLVQNG